MQPQLTHAGIYVQDIDRVGAYYTRVLGLRVTDRGHAERLPGRPEVLFMSASPTSHHQVVLVGWPKDAQIGHSSVNQLSFRVGSVGELRAMYRALIESAIAAVTPINHGNAFSLYTHDPEGNGIEVYLDLPWYVSQPHGEPLDLSLSDEELFARTEEMVQKDPSFMTREAWAAQLKAKLATPSQI